MKIIFLTINSSSPSSIFYAASLKQINGQFEEVNIVISEDIHGVDYRNYEVALFMGFATDLSFVKAQNKNIIIGLIEPRASQSHTNEYIDFLVVNSIESKDYFYFLSDKIVEYYTYPEVSTPRELKWPKNKLVIGYHGNKIHLDSMFPRITNAIEKLHHEVPLELWAMYNIKKLDRWNTPEKKKLQFDVRHIQYSEHGYAAFMAHVDIGIIPQLIPVKKNKLLRSFIGSLTQRFNERFDNYFLRFKETTNIGRALVFAQYSIPIVSDMTPSACAFLGTEECDMLAYSSDGWYRSLRRLAINEKERHRSGTSLNNLYEKVAKPLVQNKRLLAFISSNFGEKSSNFK